MDDRSLRLALKTVQGWPSHDSSRVIRPWNGWGVNYCTLEYLIVSLAVGRRWSVGSDRAVNQLQAQAAQHLNSGINGGSLARP